MKHIQRIILVLIVSAGTLILLLNSNSVKAVPLVSPNFRLDAQVTNSFGGFGNSTSYQLVSSGGEAVVGNGSGGSYKLGAGYISQLQQSLELRLNSSGLQGYYPLDTNTGVQAYDASSNNNNGGTANGASWSIAKVGNGLVFDGVNDSMTIPDAAANTLAGPFTVSLWVKIDSLSNKAGSFVEILAKGTSSTSRNYNIYASRATGFISISSSIAGVSKSANSNTNIVDGLWHHVVYTYGPTRGNIYVDGVQKSFFGTSGASSDTPAGVINVSEAGALQGGLDEIKLFNRELSADEVRDIYDSNNAGVANALTIPQITAGASQNALLDMQVTTDAGGYNSAISQNFNLRHTDATTTVPNLSNGGTVTLPVLWDEGNTKGMGFTLTGGISIPGIWGTGPVSYKYAPTTTTPTTFFSRTGLSGGVKEVTNVQFKLDVPTTQKSGQYSNIVTITATAKP